jgi:hypothetical protein
MYSKEAQILLLFHFASLPGTTEQTISFGGLSLST